MTRNLATATGGIGLLCVALIALLGPLLIPRDPFAITGAPLTPPGLADHLLGTDYLGRDLLTLLVHGARASLVLGLTATAITLVIGVTVGAIAGYYRGGIDAALVRVTEFFQILPALLFVMVIVALFEPSLLTISLAIGLVSWPALARITRTEVMRIYALDYVTAVRASGMRDSHLIFKVILPNIQATLISQATLMVGAAILFEAGLSFLGLTDPNVASWGQIIGSNRPYIRDASYAVTLPGLMIFLTVASFCPVGDGVSESRNPRLRP